MSGQDPKQLDSSDANLEQPQAMGDEPSPDGAPAASAREEGEGQGEAEVTLSTELVPMGALGVLPGFNADAMTAGDGEHLGADGEASEVDGEQAESAVSPQSLQELLAQVAATQRNGAGLPGGGGAAPSVDDLLAQMPESQGGPGALSAAAILESIEKGSRAGCGCLGMLVLGIITAYFMTRWLLGGADYALVLCGLLGGAAMAGSVMRPFHLMTVACWFLLGLIALVISPTVTPLVFADYPLDTLPAWMLNRTITWAIAGGSLVGLGFLLLSMRSSISTPEIAFAIQIQAAAKRTERMTGVGEQLQGALEVLKEQVQLGVWPIQADFLDVQDEPIAPRGHTGMVLKPLLAVRARPSDDEEAPWFEFGAAPYLEAPDPWRATIPHVGPRGIGQIFCDAEHLHYVPLRKGAEVLKIPLASVKRARARIHAIELDTGAVHYAFVGVHLWRTLSLALFLRAHRLDTDDVEHALWATSARPDAPPSASSALADIPSADALRQRLDACAPEAAGQGRAPARQSLRRVVEPLLREARPTYRALAGQLLGAAEALDAQDGDAAHGQTQRAIDWMDHLPGTPELEAADDLLEDLDGASMLLRGDWGQAILFTREMAVPDGADVDQVRRCVEEAIDALSDDDPALAAQRLAEIALNPPTTLFLETLDHLLS